MGMEDIARVLRVPQGTLYGIGALLDDKRSKEESIAMFKRGIQGDLNAADMRGGEPAPGDIGAKILNTVTDIAIDPMILVGAAGKGAAAAGKLGRAGRYVDAATTVGKLGEEASKGDKLAQAARYLYQGTMGTGDLMHGIGAGTLLAGLEKYGVPAIAGKLAGKAATGVAVDALEEPASKLMDDALRSANDVVNSGLVEKSDKAVRRLAADKSRAEQLVEMLDNGDAAFKGGRELMPGPSPIPMGRGQAPQVPLPSVNAPQQQLTGMMDEVGGGLKALQGQPALPPGPGPAIPMGAVPERPTAFLPSVNAPQQPLTGIFAEATQKLPELPMGPRVGEAVGPDYPEMLSQLLGKKRVGALGEGERADSLIRSVLESGRSGSGRFTTAQQRALLEFLMKDPEGLAKISAQLRYPQ